MAGRKLQQGGERRIASALRLVMVALLLLLQIAFVVLLSRFLQERFSLVYAALELAALLTALHVLNAAEPPSYKYSWLVLILTVPVIGLILWVLWSGETQRRRLRGQMPPPEVEPESAWERCADAMAELSASMPTWTRTARSLCRRGFLLCKNTETVYFSEGGALLRDLTQRMKQAERFVFLEYFILAEGQIWQEMSAVLCDRAQSGVEVKIIFDDFGNIRRFSAAELARLRAAGVELIEFNPVQEYVNRLYFNYRDHRKIAVIDGESVYTGGVNIADEYANLTQRFGYWKDSGVRLTGEGAWGLTAQFLYMWTALGGELRETRDFYRPRSAAASDGCCQCFTDGPQNNPDNPAEDVFLQLIASAQRSVYITTPYFIPDETLLCALCVAGDGGVDVRLILPGIPDHRYTALAASSYLGTLLSHGVRVYRYTPGFLHSKSILADRACAFVGSVNMDYRSFDLNFECGSVLYGGRAVRELGEDLDAILADSQEVTLASWTRRSILQRIAERLLRRFAIWM